MSQNLKIALFALLLLVIYLWDQDRRSYVIYPELGVATSTKCHFNSDNALDDLALCDGEKVKIKQWGEMENEREDWILIQHGYNFENHTYGLSTMKRIYPYFGTTITLPKDTGSVSLE